MQARADRLVIIGGGPAGMMAGIKALEYGVRVTLLEQNEKLGKKLYITGKGRCNLSNAAQGEDFMRQIPRNPRFLYSALDHLDCQALRDMLGDLQCPTVVERGQRVFPEAQKASDVTRALARGLQGADIRLHARVTDIRKADDGFDISLADGETLHAGALVLATGGLSYAVTGATGDGYRFAQGFGMQVTDRSPALVPIETVESWPKALQGLTLKNVRLSAREGKKLLFDEQGEMLFTHFGVSGPLVLTLSSLLSGRDHAKVQLSLDMKPALSHEQLVQRLQRMLAQSGRKQLKNLLPELLPASMAEIFPTLSDIDFGAQASQVTAAQRDGIARLLKAIPLSIKALRGYNEAVITRGGIDVRDIDPSSMMSKTVPGLFLAGELIDVDGFTGGFNLQIAFSTGALAGVSAARYITKP